MLGVVLGYFLQKLITYAPPDVFKVKGGELMKIQKRMGYATADFTGEVVVTRVLEEENHFHEGDMLTTVICQGKYNITLDGKKKAIDAGEIKLQRSCLINQIVDQCTDESDNWIGKVLKFTDGRLQSVSEEI